MIIWSVFDSVYLWNSNFLFIIKLFCCCEKLSYEYSVFRFLYLCKNQKYLQKFCDDIRRKKKTWKRNKIVKFSHVIKKNLRRRSIKKLIFISYWNDGEFTFNFILDIFSWHCFINRRKVQLSLTCLIFLKIYSLLNKSNILGSTLLLRIVVQFVKTYKISLIRFNYTFACFNNIWE